MPFCFKKKALLAVLIALSMAALAKPAHLLFHVGKGVAYPVRHPKKSSHGMWKLITEVF
jgi:hypothetical protein